MESPAKLFAASGREIDSLSPRETVGVRGSLPGECRRKKSAETM
jgi:hypothetical protein